MIIVWLDEFLHLLEVEAPIFFLVNWLGLDSSERCSSSSLIDVGVCLLTDDIFVSPPTVCQQSTEVTLRTTSDKKASFLPKQVSRETFKLTHSWVIPKHIIPNLSTCHDLAHLRTWSGHCIAPQVNLTHV